MGNDARIVFDRHVTCQVEELENNQARVTATLCDTYHHIAIAATVRLPDAKILAAQAEFIRIPDEMCKETGALMSKLEGLILGRGIRKNASRIFSGPAGCVHLNELVVAAAEGLAQGILTIRCRSYEDFENAKDAFTDEMAGKCYFHTENAKKITQSNSKMQRSG